MPPENRSLTGQLKYFFARHLPSMERRTSASETLGLRPNRSAGVALFPSL
jgi:hypothetical protein